jgi:hypothetical protein
MLFYPFFGILCYNHTTLFLFCKVFAEKTPYLSILARPPLKSSAMYFSEHGVTVPSTISTNISTAARLSVPNEHVWLSPAAEIFIA